MNSLIKSILHLVYTLYYSLNSRINSKKSVLLKSSLQIDNNNHISLTSSYLKRTSIKVKGRDNKIRMSTTLVSSYVNVIGNGNTIEILNEEVISNLKLQIVGTDCHVQIGQKTTINGAHIVCGGDGNSVIIGEDCMFADRIEIWASDTHPIYSNCNCKAPINYPKNIIINNHVWIGQCACVLKGVEIGHDSIIGMAAVVTKTIPPTSVVAGNPAHIINSGITWGRQF